MHTLFNTRNRSQKRGVFDFLWAIVYLILLLAVLRAIRGDDFCHQMGVDFRGYYASAQIAWEHGWGAVYDQDLQKEFQAVLLFDCPTPAEKAPLYVGMPYLPVFVVFLLPFAWVDFTIGYVLWLIIQIVIFTFALWRFSRTMGETSSVFHLLQWGLCLPLISNLYLGQINALLVLLFGEFVLVFSRDQRYRSGLWLSTLLIKPHMLILLLPGFVLSRNRPVLLGFLWGGVLILGASLHLVGFQGLAAIADLTLQFAGSLIETTHGMMNFRSLALNLQRFIPAWTAWLIAGLGIVAIFILVIRCWSLRQATAADEQVMLGAVTILGTFVISWHAHFYMQMLVVPLLLCLDLKGLLAPRLRIAWLFAPPLIYLLAHWLIPGWERNFFGLGMLMLNIFLLFGLGCRFQFSLCQKGNNPRLKGETDESKTQTSLNN